MLTADALAMENLRLRAEVDDLTARLGRTHEVLAGYNAQPCGPRTAFVLGFVMAGGTPEDAEKILDRKTEPTCST